MTNPILIDCPKNSWTKVATDATNGFVHVDLPYLEITWYQTYRDTGESAPIDLDNADGSVKLLIPTDPIRAKTGIDVYVWPRNYDGKVRVDV